MLLFSTTVKASSYTSNVIASVSVGGVCFITTTNTLVNFGNIDPTQGTPVSNDIAFADSFGNEPANILVAGTNWINEPGYGSNTFYVSNTLWNPTSASPGVGNALTLFTGFTSLFDTQLQIAAPNPSFPRTQTQLFVGVNIPGGAPAGPYTQNIVPGYSCLTYPNPFSVQNVIATANVQPACFISLSTNAIDFGSITPTNSVPTANAVSVNDPGGNIPANILVDAGNWISGSNTFYVSNTLWNPVTEPTYTGTPLNLAPNLVDTLIQEPAPIIANPTTSNTLYFGLAVPAAQSPGLYTQNVYIENEC